MPEYNVKKEDPATTALKMDHISEWRSKLEMMPDDVLKRIIAGVGPEDIPQGLEIFAMGVAADRTKLRGAQSEPAPTSPVKDQVIAGLDQGQGLDQLANVEIPPGGITEAVPAAPAEEAPAAPTAMAEGGRISPQYKESKKKTSKAMMAAYHNKYAEPGERQFDYPTKANLVVAKEGGIVSLANGGATDEFTKAPDPNTGPVSDATKAAAAGIFHRTDAPPPMEDPQEGEGTIYKVGRDVVNWAKENPGEAVGWGLMSLPGVGLAARGGVAAANLIAKFGSKAIKGAKTLATDPTARSRALGSTSRTYGGKEIPGITKVYETKKAATAALNATKKSYDLPQEVVKQGKGWTLRPTKTNIAKHQLSGKGPLSPGLKTGLAGLGLVGLSKYAGPGAGPGAGPTVNPNALKQDKKKGPKQDKKEGMSRDTALGLMAMGAKMMQTKRPDALGVTGEGLDALVDQSVIQRELATDVTTAEAKVRANEIAARQNKLTAMTAVQKSLMTARSKAQDAYGKTIMALIEGIPGAEDQKAAIASSRKVHDLKIVMKDLDTQLENLRKQFVDYGVNIGGAPQQVAGATGGSNLGGRAEITRA